MVNFLWIEDVVFANQNEWYEVGTVHKSMGNKTISEIHVDYKNVMQIQKDDRSVIVSFPSGARYEVDSKRELKQIISETISSY